MPEVDELIQSLPDRPALEQLGRALWAEGTLRGAAILVGAGVSRSARLLSDDAPIAPLWRDLSSDMTRELYGTPTAAMAPQDPLRLAEEYRVSFGDAALSAFLRRHVRDDAWDPGAVHGSLLDLPWSDVLTTNYDTLLERAARRSKRRYDTVRRQADLAHARAPRIIKLHGSLEDGSDLVFSEEDYRTYPTRHAAFVNVARQVFIENELCLLGFSGDDPNFLQWIGWVRDNLGGNARRIYLVGALNLPSVRRRLLEARNVVPIDFGPIVSSQADPHNRASELFLAYLASARPTSHADWEPADFSTYPSLNHEPDHGTNEFQDPEKVVAAYRGALALWQDDRRTYPGWIVCPPKQRTWIRYGTDRVANLLLVLETLSKADRKVALLEIAWRYDRSGQPVPPWLARRMDAIATTEELHGVEADLVRSLVTVLFGAARSTGDADGVEELAARLAPLQSPSDVPALIAYQRCLFAREQLDLAFVAEHLSEVSGDDPMWGLRRAALYYGLHAKDDARRSIRDAARELLARTQRDPSSVALRSRLSWARLIASTIRAEDSGALAADLDGHERLELQDYDPKAELRLIDSEVDEAIRKRYEERDIEATFEPGRYRDNRRTIRLGSATSVTPIDTIAHLIERAGLPIRTDYVNVLASRTADALDLHYEPTVSWYCALLATRPSYSKGLIDKHLSRLAIARLDAALVDELQQRVITSVSFWRDRIRSGRPPDSSDLEALRLFIEVLARLGARADPAKAKEYVSLAVELACDPALNHFWLYEHIDHLLKWGFEAVPPSERHELSAELMRVPLGSEKEEGARMYGWPDPAPYAYQYVRRADAGPEFAARVAELIGCLRSENRSRPEAAIRLFYLHEARQLEPDEQTAFAEALWSGVPSDKGALPQGLQIYPHALLIAPSPAGVDARERVYDHLFNSDEPRDPTLLSAVGSGHQPPIEPNSSDAAQLFDNTASWRPRELDEASLADALARSEIERSAEAKALVLSTVAAPALASEDRTEQRAEALLSFLAETDLTAAVPGLPRFYALSSTIDQKIQEAFRGALRSGEQADVAWAVDGLDRWLRWQAAGQIVGVPDVIIEYTLRALERRRETGLPNLVYIVRRLIESDLLSDVQVARATEVLGELHQQTDYEVVLPDSRMAVSLSFLRAECVRLALALRNHGINDADVDAWITSAPDDPLPEVRYAEALTASQAAEAD